MCQYSIDLFGNIGDQIISTRTIQTISSYRYTVKIKYKQVVQIVNHINIHNSSKRIGNL